PRATAAVVGTSIAHLSRATEAPPPPPPPPPPPGGPRPRGRGPPPAPRNPAPVFSLREMTPPRAVFAPQGPPPRRGGGGGPSGGRGAMQEAYSRLQYLLEERGLTRAELQRRIADRERTLNVKTLYRLADPDRPLERIDLRTAGAVCRALGVTLGDLVVFAEA